MIQRIADVIFKLETASTKKANIKAKIKTTYASGILTFTMMHAGGRCHGTFTADDVFDLGQDTYREWNLQPHTFEETVDFLNIEYKTISGRRERK